MCRELRVREQPFQEWSTGSLRRGRMADKPPTPDDFDARLHAANARRPDRETERMVSKQGIGFGFRIGAELVSALIVGVGIGLLLDYWLGTKPWMLVLFFVLGAAAGMLNVFRAMGGFGYAVGYRRPSPGTTTDQSGGGADASRKDAGDR